MKKESVERRKFARVPRDFVVTFKELVMSEDMQEQLQSKLVNISASGILFESEKAFPEDTMLKLELQIQRWEKYSSGFIKFDQTSISKPFVAICKVVRTETIEEDKKYLLGVSLENVDKGHSEALKRYLEHLLLEIKKI